MIQINVQADISRALEKLARIPREVEEKALPRALNKTAEQAKVQASRDIRDAGYNLKAAAIKKNISIRRASKSELRALVRATGRPIPLINYCGRPSKSQKSNGVVVNVKNGSKLVRGAFIATMQSGHTGIYERVGNSHKKVTHGGVIQWRGLPIHELFGPSIPSAFMNQTVQDSLIAAVREKFPRLFEHEIKYLSLK